MVMAVDTLTVTVPAAGTIVLPWWAVGGVTVRRWPLRKVLFVRPAPDVTPTTAGVLISGQPKLWRTASRQGLTVELGITDSDAATIAAATAWLSAGRVVVQGPGVPAPTALPPPAAVPHRST